MLIIIKKDKNNNNILVFSVTRNDKQISHRVENPEANPLIPSIKFNEFINKRIHNIEKIIAVLSKKKYLFSTST